MPEGNELYQSFLINKDLTVVVYDVNYSDGSKKVSATFQIIADGSITKIK